MDRKWWVLLAIASGKLATARSVGMMLGVGLSGAVLTTVLARSHQRTIVDAVAVGLHVATIAAARGGLVSLARPGRKEAADSQASAD
jgi:hypothetical protein